MTPPDAPALEAREAAFADWWVLQDADQVDAHAGWDAGWTAALAWAARAIEARIVTDPADRYERWPHAEGETSYGDACAKATNSITTNPGYEDWWPVIQAGAFLNALEPVILRAAASLLRQGGEGGGT